MSLPITARSLETLEAQVLILDDETLRTQSRAEEALEKHTSAARRGNIARKARDDMSEALRNCEPPTGSVVSFSLVHNPGGSSYGYAALRVGQSWYTTGNTCPPCGYSWAGLRALGEAAYLATEFVTLTAPAISQPIERDGDYF